MITLPEQIEYAEGWAQYSEEDKAILATLRRVDAVEVPVEPEEVKSLTYPDCLEFDTTVISKYIDAMRAQLEKVKGGGE